MTPRDLCLRVSRRVRMIAGSPLPRNSSGLPRMQSRVFFKVGHLTGVLNSCLTICGKVEDGAIFGDKMTHS